jgi:hypothetical protein
MANVTKSIRGIAHVFPVGTSVSIYRRTMRHGVWEETGSSLASAAVASDGSLSFSNVPDDQAGYVMVAAGTRVATGVTGATSWATRH